MIKRASKNYTSWDHVTELHLCIRKLIQSENMKWTRFTGASIALFSGLWGACQLPLTQRQWLTMVGSQGFSWKQSWDHAPPLLTVQAASAQETQKTSYSDMLESLVFKFGTWGMNIQGSWEAEKVTILDESQHLLSHFVWLWKLSDNKFI